MIRYIIALLIFTLVGCGYTTSGFVSVYEEDSIIIKPVVNKITITSEARKFATYNTFPILIENKLTNEIINKFNIDGHFKVVSQGPNALELSCTVTDYTKEALRYETSDDDVEEQRLRLYAQIKLVSSSGKVLKDEQVVGETTYFLTGTKSKSETAAQVDLVDDTARRISEAVIEAW